MSEPDLTAPDRYTPADMADCMTCGHVGVGLVRVLHHYFPNAARGDVYMAIGIAMSLMQADLVLAQMENRLLRQAGAKLPTETLAA